MMPLVILTYYFKRFRIIALKLAKMQRVGLLGLVGKGAVIATLAKN